MNKKQSKKYLLYIHDERFRAEEEKSGLINKLLADYYHTPRQTRSLNVSPSNHFSVVTNIPGVQKGVDGIKPKQGKMCKHGQRGQCSVPKCENYIDSSTNR